MSYQKSTTVNHAGSAAPAASSNVTSTVMTAFFAAVIFLGIQSFRIPLPAAVGTPFLHFGHIFVMLAILCLGSRRSAIAGVLGLVIFDLLNGYIQSIPNVFVSTIIKCLLVGTINSLLKKLANGNAKKEYACAVICAAIYGITNIVVDFIWSAAELILLGSAPAAAITAELTSIPATMINAGFTVIGIALLYVPVTSAYKRVERR
ncbi:MAG: ECF transporter S component [Eubacteriales bacterium]|nr:ECF transporter S component [Eubacteriales bacterium]